MDLSGTPLYTGQLPSPGQWPQYQLRFLSRLALAQGRAPSTLGDLPPSLCLAWAFLFWARDGKLQELGGKEDLGGFTHFTVKVSGVSGWEGRNGGGATAVGEKRPLERARDE